MADLDSTNGTTLDGTRVGTRPVRFPPGALLRIGESVLRLSPSGGRRLGTEPDGEGHVRVISVEAGSTPGDERARGGTDATARTGRTGPAPGGSRTHGPSAPAGEPGGGRRRESTSTGESGAAQGRGTTEAA